MWPFANPPSPQTPLPPQSSPKGFLPKAASHSYQKTPYTIKFSLHTPSSETSTRPVNNNHLIQILCNRGHLKQALLVLSGEPNPTQKTYEYLLLACARENSPSDASAVRRRLIEDGFDQDPFISTKLINLYSQFNSLDDAREVFEKTREKTIYVWNALLRALALAGADEEVVSLYREMGRSQIAFDSFSYSHALKACAGSERAVREVHGHALRRGFSSCVHVSTTLVDAYARLGWVSFSRRVFDEAPVKNVFTWSAIIACYAKNGSPFEALELFRSMAGANVLPNSVTMVSVIQACAVLLVLGHGKLIHAYVLRRGFESIVPVPNALIVMYAKCGDLELARRVFDGIRKRDVVSWNSMILGYAIHGLGREAIQVFEEMVDSGVRPNIVTFVSVLGACSHIGLIEEGQRLFESMASEYGVTPIAEHYACVVDLLGRAGRLNEACEIIEEMRIEPGPAVWGALLGACRIHNNVELAERACEHLFGLEPTNAGNYVLLANIYAEAELWDEVNRLKKTVEEKGLQKVSGCSWIEVKKKIYSFTSVDELNPQIELVHALLVKLSGEMKESGYVPNTKLVLYDLNDQEKEELLLGHSEKLALAFGLINSSKGETIRISKNLRLCEDCHSVTKFVSRFANREIIVRDVNRFHHFRDGRCSCADYW
ncbi:Pentatricopeptide repeat-containing protein [Acorus gramineus]|uniref:Pentatricopeptide repeat-containing protein n=1 Tax=Acorus gramineus TaxID=55184 RepID=A0AAV9B0X0_ACOGR|nr:Pentatricopeptide repeat-containing protein [Acorus gramineus]